MTNLAIFVSGNGTNCENIIRYFKHHADIRVRLVLSNRADSYALVRAQNLGIETRILPKTEFNNPDQLMPILQEFDINFIVLAGFLLFIPDFLIDAFDRRMINIHPALLPKFGGKGMWGHHVHEAVKAAGETETGMTVHWVSREIDGGEIIAQFKTALTPDDTPDDIADKEHVLEMEHFPRVIEEVIRHTKE
ncbi:MAG: phosphoribosylglycinamide formyltransferase [Prevotella sp.]|nr:phosphoribosylglycinamide formyltransferase [Prevotella sp.]